jgi:hypothetical protein
MDCNKCIFDSSSNEETVINTNTRNILFDDDDDNIINAAINSQLLADSVVLLHTTPRPSYHVRDRLIWIAHVEELSKEGAHTFTRMYRMKIESFNKLCNYLHPFLQVDKIMSRRRTNKVYIGSEIIIACYLRYVSGGSYLDIRTAAGISIASFYRCVTNCIDAILQCQQLSYLFPQSLDKLSIAADAMGIYFV